jgi:hypothetical protein
MQYLKLAQYFVFTVILVLAVASCKCPIMSKFCHCKNIAGGAGLEITDVRIGTGDKEITEGKIQFGANEKIIITFNVKNFTTLAEYSGAKNLTYYYIRQDLIVRDNKGGVVLLMPSIMNEKKIIQAMPQKFTDTFSLSNVAGLKPGNYTVSLLATDLIGFHTAFAEVPIIII